MINQKQVLFTKNENYGSFEFERKNKIGRIKSKNKIEFERKNKIEFERKNKIEFERKNYLLRFFLFCHIFLRNL